MTPTSMNGRPPDSCSTACSTTSTSRRRRSIRADKDLRLTLLAHFDKPTVTGKTEEENLIDRCESGFESQVFIALTALGYRVVPQVKTGAYRIDMVVEGASDTRLAIECDGDEYHGP